MASSFMGLYVQREAIVAAQKALDITGNNLSNANTVGYSRQRLDVCSVTNTGHNLMYNTSISMAGQGVDQVGVGQYRDALIDEKVRGYTTTSNEYSLKSSVMSEVETVLDNIESEDSGFAVNIAKFKEALQAFSVDNADRQELASVAQQAAQSVVRQIRYMDERITEISKQTLEDAQGAVTKVNTILKSMGELNEQITTSYINMGYIAADMGNYQVDNDYGPLELKDQMNLLIDELSQYGPVEVREQNNGSFTISFANRLVVHNEKFAQIAMTEVQPEPFDMDFVVTDCGTYDEMHDTYSGLMTSKQWAQISETYGNSEEYIRNYTGDDKPAIINISGEDRLESGALRGFLDVYNGDGPFAEPGINDYKGIEYYRDMLNGLAKTMTEEFNKIYEPFGFGILTYENPEGEDAFHTAAANIKLTDEWLGDPTLIAQPEQFGGNPEDEMDELNNDYIHKMLGVFQAEFNYGFTGADGKTYQDPLKCNFEDFVSHISDNLGTQIESNNKLLNTIDIMLESSTTARDEIMGVSINEEGVSMMNYQKWYNAIARMITTLDQALDKVINGMGIVGL